METYRIGEAATLLGVSPDSVRRWIDNGRLAAGRTSGGQRLVRGRDLAQFAETMAVAPVPATASSARNRFVGIVTGVRRDKVMAQVDMVAGPHRLVSLMSREAVDELGLEVGSRAVASVKATQVIVEVPAGEGASR
jgi:molybdopterin-binding protein